MKNTHIKLVKPDHLLTAPIKQSLIAARSLLMNESLVSLLIEEQIKELSRIRKQYPTLLRVKAIEVAFLNAAIGLKNNKAEAYCLTKIKKTKKSPQQDWLKLHKSFVLNLSAKSASLREIESAILYRFHHRISHSKIAEFLKVEGAVHV